MAIVQTVNFYNFERAFIEYNRNENFSYEGKRILFDYLENLSDDLGEPIELDVIALCCEYSERSLEEACEYASVEYDAENPEYTIYDLESYVHILGSYECTATGQHFVVIQDT